jgi:hypothetical protein
MAGKWPQEMGQYHRIDDISLEKGEMLQLGGRDKAGKRQPELMPGQENGLFKGEVDLIVDGGPTGGGRASTVVDLTGAKPVLVREGTLSKDELKRYL